MGGGDALHEAVKNVEFDGITGFVKFNADGDRLASYFIMNAQSTDSGDLGAVRAATFDSATDQITMQSGEQLIWMDGKPGMTVPEAMTACKPGFYKEESLLC